MRGKCRGALFQPKDDPPRAERIRFQVRVLAAERAREKRVLGTRFSCREQSGQDSNSGWGRETTIGFPCRRLFRTEGSEKRTE